LGGPNAVVAALAAGGGRWAVTGRRCWCCAGFSTAPGWPSWPPTTGSADRRPTGICTRASTSSPRRRRQRRRSLGQRSHPARLGGVFVHRHVSGRHGSPGVYLICHENSYPVPQPDPSSICLYVSDCLPRSVRPFVVRPFVPSSNLPMDRHRDVTGLSTFGPMLGPSRSTTSWSSVPPRNCARSEGAVERSQDRA
jgi:hypothetical protein